MNKTICVYSSSSNTVDKVYFDAAFELGKEIALRGDYFLFGGGMTGLMGATAQGVHKNKGRVIGIIPKALNVKGIVYENCDELIETKGMRERKGLMDSKSDAFIALPGGYGTFEELLEIITLKQLRYHDKPIVILNINSYYEKLQELFEVCINQNFAKEDCRNLYYVTNNIREGLEYIDQYIPTVFSDKWLTDVVE